MHHKWQSHDVWLLRYEVQQTEFFVILDRFLPFYPPDNPKNQNFEKVKKKPGDIIISHMHTINDNHRCMVPEIWSVTGRIFAVLDCFLPFYTPNNPKNQNFEKIRKKSGDITILHMCNINDNQMIYDSWDIKHNRQILFVILDHFLLFNLPNNSK